ncbi:MAG: hypothetical protein RLZZ628_4460, partial [Bacteroidota bacterium]
NSLRTVLYKLGYKSMYGFYGFHGLVRIFFYFLLETKHWSSKKSVRIGEIRRIRTSIRILMYPKVEPKNETSLIVSKIRRYCPNYSPRLAFVCYPIPAKHHPALSQKYHLIGFVSSNIAINDMRNAHFCHY